MAVIGGTVPLSKKQLRWAHTASGTKALGTEKVKEWDQEAKGKNLPEKATPGHVLREADFRAKSKKTQHAG